MFYYDRIKEAELVLGADRVEALYQKAKEDVDSQYPDGDSLRGDTECAVAPDSTPF